MKDATHWTAAGDPKGGFLQGGLQGGLQASLSGALSQCGCSTEQPSRLAWTELSPNFLCTEPPSPCLVFSLLLAYFGGYVMWICRSACQPVLSACSRYRIADYY
jgi:hypothetical protein